jgi:tetratricopeptide (TPR) repeat protein
VALATLARALTDAERYDEAQEAWERVREMSPTRETLSTARRELDRLHILRKLRYEPDSADLYVALGNLDLLGGAIVEAAESLQAASEHNPDDAQIALRLAGLYENLELVDPALETYRRLAALAPGDEQLARKVRDFELLSRDPGVRQRWLNSNEIVLSLGETGDTHPPTCRQAAEAWGNAPFEGTVSATDLARAAALYEESIAAQPEDMHAYVDAARIHEALGDYGRAASLWRRGLTVKTGDRGAEAHARRLELLDRLEGQGTEEPEHAEGLVEIGALYRQAGETEQAAAFFRRALAIDPDRPTAWLGLAAAYADAGRYPGAVEALERGLEQGPNPAEARVMRSELALLQTRLERAPGSRVASVAPASGS